MHLRSLLISFSVLAAATPILSPRSDTNTYNITTDQILSIAPNSSTCANPPAVGECATAEQAAPAISASFSTYSVDSRAEQAALVALMAFETLDFRYNRNHFPGVAGQGTRNMQSPTYNDKYAASIPALSEQYASATGNVTAILDLLVADDSYDFGSAAWFLTTQCSDSVRAELQQGSESGWEGYITSCVGTTVTDERKDYWLKAVDVLGVGSE
ncbi:hypothetical protein UA08_07963 [Talaromyces atroroseus]|uniref:Uncharacterized protein n=1 Tax=Talaromyces atroroseus TaxID=1441469 RepID=A0A225A9S5_TALAT|nr:hypothetical protein UA08_07963 [Talaromyces atroroseus]OKL56820.1 hypothetical protein UA08_07963 [Talaromyces atroroseus]